MDSRRIKLRTKPSAAKVRNSKYWRFGKFRHKFQFPHFRRFRNFWSKLRIASANRCFDNGPDLDARRFFPIQNPLCRRKVGVLSQNNIDNHRRENFPIWTCIGFACCNSAMIQQLRNLKLSSV